jgi:hypothetical protein
MTTPMQQLIDEDTLIIYPANGQFDTDAVAARILATGFSFRDETVPTRFVVSSDVPSRDGFLERRRDDPDAGFPSTLMMDVQASAVVVWPVSGFKPLQALSEDFLQWLTNTYECRVENDDGGELPSRVNVEPRS